MTRNVEILRGANEGDGVFCDAADTRRDDDENSMPSAAIPIITLPGPDPRSTGDGTQEVFRPCARQSRLHRKAEMNAIIGDRSGSGASRP